MTKRRLFSVLVLLLLGIMPAAADEFKAQEFLGMTAGNNVGAAIKRGEKDGKKILVFAYDSKKKGQAFHIEGMLGLEETRKLVRENFLLVITDFKDKNIRDVVGSESQDRPVYLLFNTDGKVIQKGTAAMGAGPGAKVVKEWTSKS